MTDPKSFGAYIKSLREARGYSINQLALYSDVSAAHISRIERGVRDIPSPEFIEKLAKGLRVSYEHLMEKAGYIKPRDSTSSSIADIFIKNSDMVKIPVLGSIRAGQPIEMISELAPEYELVEKELVRGHEAFILRVVGDSMIGDQIYDGDRVVVIVTPDFSPSDICVVAINGEEATLKRVKRQGDQCVLTPSNPEMEPMIYPAKDVHVIGVVVEVRHRIKKKY